MKRLAAAAITLAALVGAAPAHAAYCGVSDPIWLAGHQMAQTAIDARILLAQNNISLARTLTVQALVSAKKVGTAQLSANGSRESTMEKAANQAAAEATNDAARRRALLQIQDQFSANSGIGVNACQAVASNQASLSSLGAVAQNAKATIDQVDTSPGSAGDLSESYAARWAAKDQINAGDLLHAGADPKANMSLIGNLVGLRMPKPGAELQGSAEGEAMMHRAQVTEALRSPALTSLAAVNSMNTPGLGEGGFAGTPLQALDDLIDRYGGGPQFQKWSLGLMDQSERGLLTELLRLRALSASLRQTQAEQSARMTVVVGTMLASQIQDAQ